MFQSPCGEVVWESLVSLGIGGCLLCFNPLAGKSFGKVCLHWNPVLRLEGFNPLAGKSFGKGNNLCDTKHRFCVSIPLRGSRLGKFPPQQCWLVNVKRSGFNPLAGKSFGKVSHYRQVISLLETEFQSPCGEVVWESLG